MSAPLADSLAAAPALRAARSALGERDDVWVVGYGLDSGGLWRSLPYVGFVEP